MTLTLTDVIGTPSQDGYGYTQRPAITRSGRVRGRPRFTLNDKWPKHVVDVSVVITDEQFVGWQSFWADGIRYGADWFNMQLMLDAPDMFRSGREWYLVHVIGGFTATATPARVWTVSMTLEVPTGVSYFGAVCNTIYSGPLWAPPTDVIWAGDINALPPDIIEPCHEVLA